MSRTLIWWSTGAASAIAARMVLRDDPGAIIVRCETSNEDADNYRFETDVMRRLNHAPIILKSHHRTRYGKRIDSSFKESVFGILGR